MRLTRIFVATSAMMLLPVSLMAQDDADSSVDFRLFEEVEQTTSQQQRVRRQNSDNGNNNTTPEFTLIGTSHIGDNYSAILQHRSGNIVRMEVNPDGNTRIPEYQGYNVVHIGPGTVSIRHPDDTPCIEAPLVGVRCNQAVNIAALELANGEPVLRQSPVEQQNNEEEVATEVSSDEATEEPRNPFEQLRAARDANTQSNDAPARFNRRTIADEDIPPGMRRVSTPFGDRLVPQ